MPPTAVRPRAWWRSGARCEEAPPPPGLRAGGPDTLRLGYETDGGDFEILAELDGRYLTTEVAGGFTGRVFGMYATRGSAAFDWFELGSA